MEQKTKSSLVQMVCCQAINWINAGLLMIAVMETNFSEIWIEIWQFL